MAWIESHQSLLTHRKTGRLARALGVSKITAIGHLHAFWWWSLDNAGPETGDLTDIDAADIADGACWEGEPAAFVSALIHAGFADRTGPDLEYLTVHEWEGHEGKLIAQRTAHAERMRAARAGHKPVTPPPQDEHDTAPLPARDEHVPSTLPARAALENSRVENTTQEKMRGEERADSAAPAPPRSAHPTPKSRASPTVPNWGYPAFFALRQEAFNYALPKAQYASETQAVNEILADYSDATPDDLVAFLVYRRTCYGVDPASAILLSRHKAHFGPWWAAGKPGTQVQNGGTHAPERLIRNGHTRYSAPGDDLDALAAEAVRRDAARNVPGVRAGPASG